MFQWLEELLKSSVWKQFYQGVNPVRGRGPQVPCHTDQMKDFQQHLWLVKVVGSKQIPATDRKLGCKVPRGLLS